MALHSKLPDARAYWQAKTDQEQYRRIVFTLCAVSAVMIVAALVAPLVSR